MAPTTIAAGEKSATVSIQVPSSPTEYPEPVRLTGTAMVEGKAVVTEDVVPAEDMTQAFITKHIVPVDALLIDVRQGPPKPKGKAKGKN
jgi:hypothetical protein